MSELVEEYTHDCRIVREDENGYQHYHYEGPLGRVQTFESPGKARLYADVQTIMGGCREEKTGERGVSPAVARAREDVLMASQAAQPLKSLEGVAPQFGPTKDRVREYVESLRNRARKEREAASEDAE